MSRIRSTIPANYNEASKLSKHNAKRKKAQRKRRKARAYLDAKRYEGGQHATTEWVNER